MEAILNLVWAFLNSPAGITLVVSVVGSIVAKIYLKKPLWRKYEGLLISGIKAAEKAIPDDSENKSMKRIDAALKYVLERIAESGKKVNPAGVADLKGGIAIIHNELEIQQTLKPVE